MPLELQYITSFLYTVEGKRHTVGYIPCFKTSGGTANYKGEGNPAAYRAMGVSGVTVATGCDLGQTSADTLRGYRLDDGVINQLIPYIGKRADDALRVLHRLPLTISLDVAAAIDSAVHAGYLRKYVIPVFERECHIMHFVDLPKEAQAAIASITFQKGVGGTKRDAPHTWAAFVRCDWADAARRLCDSSLWSAYPSRRKKEGDMLRGAV